MNELIHKLAEQCQIETYGINGLLLEFGFDYEKFAEMIVKECAKIVIEQKPMTEPADEWEFGYDTGLHTAKSAIKEHFGVE